MIGQMLHGEHHFGTVEAFIEDAADLGPVDRLRGERGGDEGDGGESGSCAHGTPAGLERCARRYAAASLCARR